MDALGRLEAVDAVERLWRRDATLFSDDPRVQAEVAPWMGWLGLAGSADGSVDECLEVVREMPGGIENVVLLGMGGSSLASLVMCLTLPSVSDAPRLRVLDTSSPRAVDATMRECDPGSSAFIVASKSGGTIEPNSLYAVFREWMERHLGRGDAGRRFFAITDPGSPLESLARDEGFAATLLAPPDIGGRYSALSVFGLLPAIMTRLDARSLLARAVTMEEACRQDARENPGALLASWLADRHGEGRDKVTLVTSDGLASFGLWVEQLMAESTGKSGTGLIPIIETDPTLPTGYGSDRAVVVVRFGDDDALAGWAADVAAQTPVHEITLRDPYDLGAEFVRWEVAIALSGFLLGINPFDQPNVAEAKEVTSRVLSGEQPRLELTLDLGRARAATANIAYGVSALGSTTARGEAVESAGGLSSLATSVVGSLAEGDYLAVLSFVSGDDANGPLVPAVRSVSRRTGKAAVVELGPRYLHSTGQLHKGGPDSGVFLIVTVSDQPRIAVPGQPYGLADLFRAQAEGDFLTLASHGRRVAFVELPSEDDIGELAAAFAEV
ncbi:MAG: hypothetical protein Kow0056_10960 [Coriobacteriia bacterium]